MMSGFEGIGGRFRGDFSRWTMLRRWRKSRVAVLGQGSWRARLKEKRAACRGNIRRVGELGDAGMSGVGGGEGQGGGDGLREGQGIVRGCRGRVRCEYSWVDSGCGRVFGRAGARLGISTGDPGFDRSGGFSGRQHAVGQG